MVVHACHSSYKRGIVVQAHQAKDARPKRPGMVVHTPIIPALSRQKQEDHKFKASWAT
jgi:hypothetical protein